MTAPMTPALRGFFAGYLAKEAATQMSGAAPVSDELQAQRDKRKAAKDKKDAQSAARPAKGAQAKKDLKAEQSKGQQSVDTMPPPAGDRFSNFEPTSPTKPSAPSPKPAAPAAAAAAAPAAPVTPTPVAAPAAPETGPALAGDEDTVQTPVADKAKGLMDVLQANSGGAPAYDEAIQQDIASAAGTQTPQQVSEALAPTPEAPPVGPVRGAADTPAPQGGNWDGLMGVLSKYAPYVGGGALAGGLGSMLAQRLQGADPSMRKALITAAITGGLGAALKAAGGVEGVQSGIASLRDRLSGGAVA